MADSTDASSRSRRAPVGNAPANACGGESLRDGGGDAADWMQPCRNHDLIEDGSVTPSELAHHIVRAIHEADAQFDNFINDFAAEANADDVKTWDETKKEVENYFAFAFLNTTKNINLTTQSLSFEEALLESYELMQRTAVGIEQVTLDQALYDSKCLARFRHLEMRIVNILCQMRHAMKMLKVEPQIIVKHDFMPKEYRCLEESTHQRNIRDFIILRKYEDNLRDIHSVFTNFLGGNGK